MTADNATIDWASHVIEFISTSVPRFEPDQGWDDMSMSAYQMGCEALIALGHAEPTQIGAIERADPQVPDVLPRWDDICAMVLALASQNDRLSYRPSDGRWPARDGLVPFHSDLEPNIGPANGLGRAYADPKTLFVLERLGLVEDGKWTVAAETVLWREKPKEWSMTFETDPRFVNAVHRALNAMPREVASEIDQLMLISDFDIAEEIERSVANYKAMEALRGCKEAEKRPPPTVEQARDFVGSRRINSMNWLFYRQWRLSDGWLTSEGQKRALAIFHDPLAMKMRQAVTMQLYPDVSFLADRQ